MKRLCLGVICLAAAELLAVSSNAKTPSQPPCSKFVHYDKSNFSISLPTISKVSLGSIGKKSDKIQAAENLTQLFDLVQYSNCLNLDRLAKQFDTKDYADAVRSSLDANNNLLGLAIAFGAYSKDPNNQDAANKVTQAAASSLTSAKNLQTNSSEPKVTEINLDALAKTFQGELSKVLENLRDAKPPAYMPIWNLITEDKKKAVRDQLKSAMALLVSDGQLQLNENDLAAFIVMPGGDGKLYFPPGLFLRSGGDGDQHTPPFSIPEGYGVSGVVFEENAKEFVQIRDINVKIGSSQDARESQKTARMIVIPGMADVHARYIAGFPIHNSQGQPIAVMTISIYKILPRPDDLENECQTLNFSAIQEEIANLLTLKK